MEVRVNYIAKILNHRLSQIRKPPPEADRSGLGLQELRFTQIKCLLKNIIVLNNGFHCIRT